MDKEALFRPRLPEDKVDIPDVGTVTVRGLSRAEAAIVQGLKGEGAIERKVLHFGMVDPALTEAEVGQWQKASTAGEVQAVSERIIELSGLAEASPRATFPGDGSEPEPGVRDVPIREAVDDGGRATGAVE